MQDQDSKPSEEGFALSAPSAHTPGPWQIQAVGEFDSVIGECFLILGPGDPLEAEYVAEADSELNARLIAAAPELLEAGRELLALLETWHPLEGTPSLTEQVGAMRAAIAKATGGQS